MKVYLEKIRIKPEGYDFSQELTLLLDGNKTSYSVHIGSGNGTPCISVKDMQPMADAANECLSKLREMSGKFFEINDD